MTDNNMDGTHFKTYPVPVTISYQRYLFVLQPKLFFTIDWRKFLKPNIFKLAL